ncbi:MAG: helix-turn-helix transcriptional regulator [Bacteroidales bacterium]
MNRRLHQFLELEELSPARFADMMGIQRSGISHILSGRNKPSFDFIQKMLLKFPNLNADWLLLGKGKPYKENSGGFEKKTNFTTEIDLFNTIVSDPKVIENQNPNPSFEEKQPSENRLNEINPDLSAQKSSYDVQNNSVETKNEFPEEKNTKMIERITVFYNDGTYEEKF